MNSQTWRKVNAYLSALLKASPQILEALATLAASFEQAELDLKPYLNVTPKK